MPAFHCVPCRGYGELTRARPLGADDLNLSARELMGECFVEVECVPCSACEGHRTRLHRLFELSHVPSWAGAEG